MQVAPPESGRRPETGQRADLGQLPQREREPDSAGVLFAYQAALAAMGASAQRALPMLGNMIHAALVRISDSLTRSPSQAVILDSRILVEQQLNLWADK